MDLRTKLETLSRHLDEGISSLWEGANRTRGELEARMEQLEQQQQELPDSLRMLEIGGGCGTTRPGREQEELEVRLTSLERRLGAQLDARTE